MCQRCYMQSNGKGHYWIVVVVVKFVYLPLVKQPGGLALSSEWAATKRTKHSR